MKLKSYEQFVNENLIGMYSYYGQGSLYPIVSKLANEGKTPQQVYTYLTTLGVDENRKIKVIYDIFNVNVMEDEQFIHISDESLFEDEIDDLLKVDTEDVTKGIDTSKNKNDNIEKALDKLKSYDDEDEEDKEDEDSKIDAVKSVLKDAEKLHKIKKMLSETLDFNLIGETDIEFLNGILKYHELVDNLPLTEKNKLKDSDFVFPDTRSWPIHNEKAAKTALIWATSPLFEDRKNSIVDAVIKRYPNLKGIGAAK